MNNDRAASSFAALGHPARVGILRLLVQAGHDGLNMGDLRARLGVPASTFSHHLKAMADAGLVAQQKKGREVISTVDFSALQAVAVFLMEDCCAGACTPNPNQQPAEEPIR
ncbi:MAG: metalloregulator ArsR/SmtB family transcription factor [Pseudomonadota bacterium]